jgi:hypothetical protein
MDTTPGQPLHFSSSLSLFSLNLHGPWPWRSTEAIHDPDFCGHGGWERRKRHVERRRGERKEIDWLEKGVDIFSFKKLTKIFTRILK